VAQLAGVPAAVIADARRYLEALESQRDHERAGKDGARGRARAVRRGAAQRPEDKVLQALRAQLQELDPDQLTPKAALETLYRLRALLGE
jgi:DNA mismatch repair protein MutS